MTRDHLLKAKSAPSDQSMQKGSAGGSTSQHAAAGLRWLFDRYPRWDLTKEDLAILLGASEKRLREWEEHVHHHDGIEITRDTLERVSLLLGIHKALAQIAPKGQEERAYRMFVQPIDLAGLEGRSVRDFLLEEGSVEALYSIRRALVGLAS